MSNKIFQKQFSSGLCCLGFTGVGLSISGKMISMTSTFSMFPLEGSIERKSM